MPKFKRYLLLAARMFDHNRIALSPLRRAASIITDYSPDQPRGQPDNAGQVVKVGGATKSEKNTKQEAKKPLQKDRRRGKLVAGGECTLAVPGFGTAEELDDHWERHGEQYPGWSKEDYCNHAVWLAEQAPKTGGIRGYEIGKNIVVRYDPYNNDYVKADVFTGVVTMFKPTKKTIYYEVWRKAEGNKK